MILNIIGIGLIENLHITNEACNLISTSEKILSLGVNIKFLEELFIEKNITPALEQLDSLYINNDIDDNNYQRIKNKIFNDLDKVKNVAFIVSGHPSFGVSLTQELLKESNKLGINTKVIPGISSFDTMIKDLEIDPIEKGSCIIDANRLLTIKYNLDPKLNYFVYHICSIGNARTNFIDPSDNNSITLLKNKLLEFFPPEHNVKLVSSQSQENGKTQIIEEKLCNLEKLLEYITFSSSLFIEGIRLSKTDLNYEFLKIIKNSMN